MKLKSLLAGMLIVGLAACSSTETTEVAATDNAEVAKVDEKIICRKEKPTGSKFPKKVCSTQAERSARAAHMKQIASGIRTNKAGPATTRQATLGN